MNLRKFSDKELLVRTGDLVKREREVLTDILHHLREIERRRLFCDLGYSSLYAYCIGEHKYSEAQTQRRIEAMRLMAEIPQIEEKVAAGELSLTNLAQARRYFRNEEKVAPVSIQKKIDLLEKLENKTSREGEKILLAEASVPPAPVKEKIRQVTATMTEIKFGADEKLMAKMKRLNGLMAHRKPNMTLSEFMNEVCEIALEKLDPLCKVHPRAQPKKSLPKAIPSAQMVKTAKRKYISMKIKRQVWKKSEGKCSNCKSEYALQTDHIVPIYQNGEDSIENLRLLCRSCNQRAAIKKLSNGVMMRYLT